MRALHANAATMAANFRKRLNVLSLVAALPVLLLPAGALGLPAAPTATAPFTVNNALVDAVTPAPASQTSNYDATNNLSGYSLTFHDPNYQYSYPICANAVMVDANGTDLNTATAIQSGDDAVITVGPNTENYNAYCITNLEIQEDSITASGSQCLQGYQVDHAIEPTQSPLLVGIKYTISLTAYTRPSPLCDESTYGTNFTAAFAQSTGFNVKLLSGTDQLLSLSIMTNSSGQASFTYTFLQPSSDYKVEISPQGDLTPGDVITWPIRVEAPAPSSTPTVVATKQPPKSNSLLLVLAIAIVAFLCLGFGIFEFVRLFQKRRNRSPEEEYEHIAQL